MRTSSTVRPLRDGVIADFQAAEDMIKGMIKMINPGRRLFTPNLRMVICIPSGITEVEKRAVKDSSEHAGAKEVYLIHEPMAAAIGIGIDVEEPMGNMIIDIGGGTSRDRRDRPGRHRLRQEHPRGRRRIHQRHRGVHAPPAQHPGGRAHRRDRSRSKWAAPWWSWTDPPPDHAVRGRDLMTGIPKEITVTYSEIAQALDKSISKIEEAILSALEAPRPSSARTSTRPASTWPAEAPCCADWTSASASRPSCPCT
jgi:rod shape-determining protein MreB